MFFLSLFKTTLPCLVVLRLGFESRHLLNESWSRTLPEFLHASFALVGSGARHITLLRLRWLICTMEINLQLFSRTAHYLTLICSEPFKQFVNCELLYKYSFNEYEIIFPSYLAVTLAKSLKRRFCSVIYLDVWSAEHCVGCIVFKVGSLN